MVKRKLTNNNDADVSAEIGARRFQDMQKSYELRIKKIVDLIGSDESKEEGSITNPIDLSEDPIRYDASDSSSDDEYHPESPEYGLVDQIVIEYSDDESVDFNESEREDIIYSVDELPTHCKEPVFNSLKSKICVICSDETLPMILESSIITSCGHTYHDGCLKTWLDIAHTCPTCRKNIKK